LLSSRWAEVSQSRRQAAALRWVFTASCGHVIEASSVQPDNDKSRDQARLRHFPTPGGHARAWTPLIRTCSAV
jgi:hypothetical protein